MCESNSIAALYHVSDKDLERWVFCIFFHFITKKLCFIVLLSYNYDACFML